MPDLLASLKGFFDRSERDEKARFDQHRKAFAESIRRHDERLKTTSDAAPNHPPHPVERDNHHNIPYTLWASDDHVAKPQSDSRQRYDHLLDLDVERRERKISECLVPKPYITHDIYKSAPQTAKPEPLISFSYDGSASSSVASSMSISPSRSADKQQHNGCGEKTDTSWFGPYEPTKPYTQAELHYKRCETWKNHMAEVAGTNGTSPVENDESLTKDLVRPHTVQRGFCIAAKQPVDSAVASAETTFPLTQDTVKRTDQRKDSGRPSNDGSASPTKSMRSECFIPPYMYMGMCENREAFANLDYIKRAKKSSKPKESAGGSTLFQKVEVSPPTPAKSTLSQSLKHGKVFNETQDYRRCYTPSSLCRVIIQEPDNCEEGIASDSEDESSEVSDESGDSDTKINRAFDNLDWDAPLTPRASPTSGAFQEPATMAWEKEEAIRKAVEEQDVKREEEQARQKAAEEKLEKEQARQKAAEEKMKRKKEDGEKIDAQLKKLQAKERQLMKEELLAAAAARRQKRLRETTMVVRRRMNGQDDSGIRPIPGEKPKMVRFQDVPFPHFSQSKNSSSTTCGQENCRSNRRARLEELARKATTPEFLPEPNERSYKDKDMLLAEQRNRGPKWRWDYSVPVYDTERLEFLKDFPDYAEPMFDPERAFDLLFGDAGSGWTAV